MDITNPGALALLVARIITVLAVAIFVIPINVQELRRDQRSKALHALRWVLLFFSLVYVLPAVLPIYNGFMRLGSEPISVLSTVSAYWQSIREIALGGMVVAVFFVARIIAKNLK